MHSHRGNHLRSARGGSLGAGVLVEGVGVVDAAVIAAAVEARPAVGEVVLGDEQIGQQWLGRGSLVAVVRGAAGLPDVREGRRVLGVLVGEHGARVGEDDVGLAAQDARVPEFEQLAAAPGVRVALAPYAPLEPVLDGSELVEQLPDGGLVVLAVPAGPLDARQVGVVLDADVAAGQALCVVNEVAGNVELVDVLGAQRLEYLAVFEVGVEGSGLHLG